MFFPFVRFFVNTLGRIIPMGLTLYVTLWGNVTADQKVILCASCIVALMVVEYFATFRPIRNFQATIQSQLELLFKHFVEAARYLGNKPQLRVNLMLKRFTWRGRRLCQYYAYGMEKHRDANLSLSIHSGFAGKVFRDSMPDVVYATHDQLLKYDLSEKERALTIKLTAIASTALVKRDVVQGPIIHKCHGVLNVDALDDAGARYLFTPEVHARIRELADFALLVL